MRKTASILFLFFLLKTASAQKEPVLFAPVTPEDFSIVPGGPDTAAAAMILADFGNCRFGGNFHVQNSITIELERTCRIRILHREGMEAATITIPLASYDNHWQFINGLRAVTYNLENGKVVETPLDPQSVFTDQVSKTLTQKKFTFPNVREGSIIQYSYKEVSPGILSLFPWVFQHAYPCLWSEYRAEVPDLFQYATLSYGYQPFYINTTDPISYKSITNYRWVMKDIPSLQPEPFTTSILNYIGRIEFQLARIKIAGNSGGDIIGSWDDFNKKLMAADEFGADLDKNNGWLEDDCKKITAGATSDLDRAQLIYAWVRDHFVCSAHYGFGLQNSLKTIFKNRSGNEAEINLVLAAMLRHVNIAADPVLLSTRKHGFVNPVYPLLTQFNYVVVRIGNDENKWFLDASESWLPFGKLPEECYNGYARVVSSIDPGAISLDADSVRETKVTMVILGKDKDGLSGHLQTTPGFYEACTTRATIHNDGRDEFVKNIRAACPQNVTIDGLELDSVARPDEPLQIAYDLHVSLEDKPDVLYFNPLMGQALKENPFKAANRQYPVEMSAKKDEVYTLSLEIPEGYTIDELPASAKYLFSEGKGIYEYVLTSDGGNIQLRSRIRLDQAGFAPEDYDKLREFYATIVKKQNETIVFKKKKS